MGANQSHQQHGDSTGIDEKQFSRSQSHLFSDKPKNMVRSISKSVLGRSKSSMDNLNQHANSDTPTLNQNFEQPQQFVNTPENNNNIVDNNEKSSISIVSSPPQYNGVVGDDSPKQNGQSIEPISIENRNICGEEINQSNIPPIDPPSEKKSLERPKRSVKRNDTFRKLYHTFSSKKSKQKWNDDGSSLDTGTNQTADSNGTIFTHQPLQVSESLRVELETSPPSQPNPSPDQIQEEQPKQEMEIDKLEMARANAKANRPTRPKKMGKKYSTLQIKVSTLKKKLFNNEKEFIDESNNEKEQELKKDDGVQEDLSEDEEEDNENVDETRRYDDEIILDDTFYNEMPIQGFGRPPSHSTACLEDAETVNFINGHYNDHLGEGSNDINNKDEQSSGNRSNRNGRKNQKKKKFFSADEFYNIGTMISKEVGHVFLLSSGQYRY